MISIPHAKRVAAGLTLGTAMLGTAMLGTAMLGTAMLGTAMLGMAASQLAIPHPVKKAALHAQRVDVKAAPADAAPADCDCGVVKLANFQAPAASGLNAVWLDSLDLSKMSCGWQRPLAAKSIGGASLKLGGIVYPHGVGTHATSQFAIQRRFAIYGGCRRRR